MEALEEKSVKRDSFEEVDRILKIVESSKNEFSSAKYKLYSYATLLFVAGVSFHTFMSFLLSLQEVEDTYIKKSPISSLFLLLCTIIVFLGFGSGAYLRFCRAKKDFNRTTVQAIEVLREIVPIVSRLESWSTLRKFELRLRLSKLGISTERIFE